MQINRRQHYKQSFQSRITPKTQRMEGDYTKDYWSHLARYCKENNQMPRLKNILDKLHDNGYNNIISIECKPQNRYGVTNYYIHLYENAQDLKLDRQEETVSGKNNALGFMSWIQDCGNNVYKLDKDGDVEKKYSGCDNANNVILEFLEEIVTKETTGYQKFMDITTSSIDGFLSQYRQ